MASTGLRADDPDETREARKIRAQYEANELSVRADKTVAGGWDFAEKFLAKHCKHPKTVERYFGAWKWIGLFLAAHRINSPADLRYAHAELYLDWRVAFKKRHGKKRVCRNTALTDLVPWKLILDEAVRLGLCSGNPFTSVKLKRDAPPEKRRLLDEEIQEIQERLRKAPVWMRVSFEISLHTGCRLRETQIPIDCVDLKRRTLTFPHPKGGRGRAFTVPIDDALLPTLQALKKSGVRSTCVLPSFVSKLWREFFDEMGLRDISFHCLRVTRVNKLFESGVPRELAMRLVNHASEAVHRIYLRERVEDVLPYRNVVSFART